MIHVCFGLHDKTGHYSKFTGTAMLSIFENTNSKVTVHILHDNSLSPDNRDKFSYVAGQYGQRVKFYNVEKLCADKIAEFIKLIPGIKTANVTIGGFYRLLTPQVISAEIEKIIYLDADIIVNMDIAELWQVDLGDKILGGVPELFNKVNPEKEFLLVRQGLVKSEDYLNSGVLLMNLKLLRKEEKRLLQGVKFRGENPQHGFWDQTVWNYCFASQALKLPVKFNDFIKTNRKENNLQIRKNIYHYTYSPGGVGFTLDISDPFNRLWMRYFAQTPWFNEETIGNLYAGFQRFHVGLKQSMVNITALMSGKTRGFFILPNDVDGLKRFFQIRDDEEIILAENQESLQKLIDAMKLSAGKKIFFIVIPEFPFQILIQAGFVYGRDFFNGFDFLSEAHGVPLNSYPLIQAM